MLIEVLKSKIHRAAIIDTKLNYIDSITLHKILLYTANHIVGEKLDIVNINNGERMETIVKEEKYGSGELTLNGLDDRKAQKGDKIILISYTPMEMEKARIYNPPLIFPNEKIIC
tara:strand:+ start:224 stop:568 length:345 start_codon:yes stop_codon:yes gene_type:complete